MKILKLETKRFKIRRLELIDVNYNYLNWFNDKKIKKFIGQINYKNISYIRF